jgi:hypothetical protein
VAVGPAELPGSLVGPGADGLVTRPALFARLRGPARVTVVSAPAGSGKTVLLRSWIAEAGQAGRAAWVAAGREKRDRGGSGRRCFGRCARRARRSRSASSSPRSSGLGGAKMSVPRGTKLP